MCSCKWFYLSFKQFFRVKKPSYMELVHKKKGAAENTSENELKLESVNDNEIFHSSSNLDPDLNNSEL